MAPGINLCDPCGTYRNHFIANNSSKLDKILSYARTLVTGSQAEVPFKYQWTAEDTFVQGLRPGDQVFLNQCTAWSDGGHCLINRVRWFVYRGLKCSGFTTDGGYCYGEMKPSFKPVPLGGD